MQNKSVGPGLTDRAQEYTLVKLGHLNSFHKCTICNFILKAENITGVHLETKQ